MKECHTASRLWLYELYNFGKSAHKLCALFPKLYSSYMYNHSLLAVSADTSGYAIPYNPSFCTCICWRGLCTLPGGTFQIYQAHASLYKYSPAWQDVKPSTPAIKVRYETLHHNMYAMYTATCPTCIHTYMYTAGTYNNRYRRPGGQGRRRKWQTLKQLVWVNKMRQKNTLEKHKDGCPTGTFISCLAFLSDRLRAIKGRVPPTTRLHKNNKPYHRDIIKNHAQFIVQY